jgi:hypothetical protein
MEIEEQAAQLAAEDTPVKEKEKEDKPKRGLFGFRSKRS